MDPEKRISRTSRRLRAACTILIWAVPVAAALYWVGLEYFPQFSRVALRDQLPVTVQGSIPPWSLVMGFLATMLPMGMVIYALVRLRRLFGLYQQGSIFESANVRCLRGVGKAMIAWSVAETFGNTLVGLAVTLHHPPGQHMLYVGVSSAQVLALIGGFMVLTIAWVMDQGREMQAEHSLIV